MRIALLADIHSNHVALEACLDYIDRNNIDGIAFLGDYVSDCPYPGKTMELIKTQTAKYKTWFVRGNREEYLIYHHHQKNDGWKYSSSSGSLLYTYENLTIGDIAFFEKIPISLKIEMDRFPSFTICHGSPGNVLESLHENTETADKYLKELDTDYLFCAHTHHPFKYRAFGKTLINCGSAGASTNAQNKAQFVVLEYMDGCWRDELVSISYDVGKIIAEFESSGLNEKALIWARSTAKVLETGEDYNMNCIELAIKRARQQDGAVDTHDIPERYWRQAAIELGII